MDQIIYSDDQIITKAPAGNMAMLVIWPTAPISGCTVREEIFFNLHEVGEDPYLYWSVQLGLDPCSNEFATAKQNFAILESSVFTKSRIFHPPKMRCMVAETSISF